MLILGITGMSGSGKTTLLRAVRSLGGLCLDCDRIYHRLLRSCRQMLQGIESAFPGTVKDGQLDRRALAAAVFADPAALQRLNTLTHPYVVREVEQALARAVDLAAIDAVALFESGLAARCDCTVCVTAPEQLRLQRLMLRDGLCREQALARVHAQTDHSRRCDYILENTDSEADFLRRCTAFIEKRLKEKEHTVMSEKYEALRERVLSQRKNGYDRISEADLAAMEPLCRDYMDFISCCKMEREAVAWTVAEAQKAGFRPLEPGMELKPGDRVYGSAYGKTVIFAVIGSEPVENGCHIAAAHIDSPRLDLKPNPLYEDAELAYFKTHYYGGIKKYQWTTVPLAIHGVVARKDGTCVNVTIGEDEDDPVFCVTDLLIHLAGDQMKKTLAEGVTGENLNILLGSRPLHGDEGSERIKLAVMNLLYDRYGICEDDFLSAELTMLPAGKAREVGLDRSLIAGYGHDDRVCAYCAFRPLLELGTPKKTAVCILADKEEIGSVGVSGMQSQYFELFMNALCQDRRRCFANSFCLSADVSNAFDPIYAETCDRRNNTHINYGMGIFKYTGARGKSGSSDASAEAMGYIRRIFADNDVIWQTGELGKVDQGGGGTVACYLANRNIPTVDAGVPVLSMHSPMELVSKLDTYMTYKGMKSFYLAE